MDKVHHLRKNIQSLIHDFFKKPLLKASNGQRWVTVKAGHLKGRHILIDSKGYIVGGKVPRSFHGHHIGKLKGIGTDANPYDNYEHHELKEVYRDFSRSHSDSKKEFHDLIHDTAKYLLELHQLKHGGKSDIIKRVRQKGGIRTPERGVHAFAEDYHESVSNGVKRTIGSKEGRPLDEVANEMHMTASELIDRLANAEAQGYLTTKDFYAEAEKTIDEMQGDGEVESHRQAIADMEKELDKIMASIKKKEHEKKAGRRDKTPGKLAASFVAVGGRLLVKAEQNRVIRFHVTSAAQKILQNGFKPQGTGVGGFNDRTEEVYTSEDPAYSFGLRNHMNALDVIRTSRNPIEEATMYTGIDPTTFDGAISIFENKMQRTLTPAEMGMVIAVHKGEEFPELEPESFFCDDPRRTFEVISVDVSNGHKRGESLNFGHEESWDPETITPVGIVGTGVPLKKSDDYNPSDRYAYRVHHHYSDRVIYIPLNRLSTPYQTDEATSPKKVSENVQKMKSGQPLRPIVIGYDHDIHDGHHRWLASERMGYTHVPCIVGGRNSRRVEAAEKRYRQMWKSDGEERWVTINGKHVQVDRNGNVVKGKIHGADSQTLDNITKKWEANGASVHVHERGKLITLSKVAFDKAGRGQGKGTAFMNDLISYADKSGKTIALTPSDSFGGSVSRLKDFYKRFGFVENKGRNKDYEISESFYRLASVKKSTNGQGAVTMQETTFIRTGDGRILAKGTKQETGMIVVDGRLLIKSKLPSHLKAMVNAGDAHWVTVKQGPLEGRHLLIDGPRPAAGKQSKGQILAGHGIPSHVIEKITGATHGHQLNHEQSEGPNETKLDVGSKVDLGHGITGEIRQGNHGSYNVHEHKTGVFLGLGSTPEGAVKNTNKELDRKGREGIKADIDAELKGPFTHKDVENYNRMTHFETTVAKLNQRYHGAVDKTREDAQKQLSRYGVNDIPADVENALQRLSQAHEHVIREEIRSRNVAPPWSITGRANYRGNPDKADAIQRNAYEKLNDAQKRVEKVVDSYNPSRNRISSDDSDAVQQLQTKIAQAEKLQEAMKNANKTIRDKKLSDDEKVAKMVESGIGEKNAREALKPDYAGRSGFPSFALTNNNANIKRMKERVEQLSKQKSTTGGETTFDGGRIVDSQDDNRVQIFFDNKPDADTRTKMKSRGFRWAPSAGGGEGAWQRQRTPEALRIAHDLMGAKQEQSTSEPEKAPENHEQTMSAHGIPTIYAHESQRPEGVKGHVVVAQRPLPGDKSWEGNSVGNGRYYASGDPEEYAKAWKQLDASHVKYVSNEDTRKMVHEKMKERGIDPSRVDYKKALQALKMSHLHDDSAPETSKQVSVDPKHQKMIDHFNSMHENFKTAKIKEKELGPDGDVIDPLYEQDIKDAHSAIKELQSGGDVKSSLKKLKEANENMESAFHGDDFKRLMRTLNDYGRKAKKSFVVREGRLLVKRGR